MRLNLKFSKSTLFTMFMVFISAILHAQNSVSVQLLDSSSKQPLVGGIVGINELKIGDISSENGIATITGIPDGTHQINVSFIGYLQKNVKLTFPYLGEVPIQIYMSPSKQEIGELIVKATRANRSIANLPTRTEVLTDEIDEAASMEPSKIAHLITHSTGIQVQTTSATSNGAVVRIQGLQGRYTQMLRDGFPMYGGFSGSLDILQIPPLDLQQVEYIKGPASTLYGGGAIGGIVNLVSKTPDKEESLLHLNISSLGARDFNAFTSKRWNKFGYTNLTSVHFQNVFDADKDGYSDVPEISKINFNPKIYFYPTEKTEIYLGLNILAEDRTGGDIELVRGELPDSFHFFLDEQQSSRTISQFEVLHALSKESNISVKNSISKYKRAVSIHQNRHDPVNRFSGIQWNSFSEVSFNNDKPKHNLTLGLNYYTDEFIETSPSSNNLRGQKTSTIGAFVNSLWNPNPLWSFETGLRLDRAEANFTSSELGNQNFALPRISIMFRPTRLITVRAGGAMGYRMPTIFNEEAEPLGYAVVRPINLNSTEAERSMGANFDIRYVSTLGFKNVLLSFNQLFYFNKIESPLVLVANNSDYNFVNTNGSLTSSGFETQIKLTIHKFTWFVGYTLTNASLDSGSISNEIILTPKHSIKGDLLFTMDNQWRIGWDYEYKSSQLLSNGTRSQTLFTTGIVIERTFGNFIVFLNGENLTDVRQTSFSSILSGPYNTPQYSDIWAPLDGRFVNLGLKIKL